MRYRLILTSFCLFLIGSVSLFLPYDKILFFIGSCIMLILFILITKHAYLVEKKAMILNPLFLYSGYILMADGLSSILTAFSLWDYTDYANTTHQTAAISPFMAILSLLFFSLGYILANKYSKFRASFSLNEKPDIIYFTIIVIVYSLVLWGRKEMVYDMGYYLGSGVGGKPLYLQKSLEIFDLGGCFLMALMGYYMSNKSRTWLIISIAVALTDIWFAIVIAQKERLFSLLLCVLFCFVFFDKKINLRQIFLIFFSTLIAIMLTGPLFLTLRSSTINEEIKESPRKVVDVINDVVSDTENVEFFEYLIRRFDEIYVVSSALETFPSKYPYQYGKTYLQGIVMSIPFIEKDSNPVTQPNEWGRVIGIGRLGDYVTGTKVPWFIEGYVNFGYFGIAVSSLVISFLLTALWNFFKLNISMSNILLFYALFYDLFVLHTGNGFMYIFKNLVMWILPLGIVVILIKYRIWIE